MIVPSARAWVRFPPMTSGVFLYSPIKLECLNNLGKQLSGTPDKLKVVLLKIWFDLESVIGKLLPHTGTC